MCMYIIWNTVYTCICISQEILDQIWSWFSQFDLFAGHKKSKFILEFKWWGGLKPSFDLYAGFQFWTKYGLLNGPLAYMWIDLCESIYGNTFHRCIENAHFWGKASLGMFTKTKTLKLLKTLIKKSRLRRHLKICAIKECWTIKRLGQVSLEMVKLGL
jgi:hypothetical protein